MSMFSEYLHQLIQNRAISISKLSRDSGVERTAIHKALADERILPYYAVDVLTYHLNLSPRESQIFRQYYKQLFDSENVRQARTIVDNIFLRLSDMSSIGADDLRWLLDSSSSDPFLEKNTYKGYADISRLLRFMIAEELKNSEPKIELAVPANVLAIQESIEKLYRGNASMTISHIICFDSSKAAEEYNLHNLECLGGSLMGCIYSNQQYHVSYYYNDMVQTRYTDPLPYFLVTHTGAICFSENCRTAIYLKEKEQIEYFHTCFYHLMQSCHQLIEYLDGSVTDLKMPGALKEYSAIMAQPCIMEIPTEKVITIFTRKGISEFLETGRLYDPFAATVRVIPESRRSELLGGFLNEIRSGHIKGRIVNDMMFTVPDNFALFTSASLCIFVYDKNRNKEIRLQERGLCRALYDWSIHFADNDCVFDKGKTEEILAGML